MAIITSKQPISLTFAQQANQSKIDKIKNIFISIYQYPTLPLIGAGLGVTGSITSLSIPVASLLGLGLGAVASAVNQTFFRVQPKVLKTHLTSKTTLEAPSKKEQDSKHQIFQLLKDKIKLIKNEEKTSVYMVNAGGICEEKLLNVLGEGGCKRAIKLEGDRALIVPNMDVEVKFLAKNWEEIVDEEIAMSKQLTEIGLLSPLSEKARISLSADSDEETIPAYLSETFEGLGKTKGWFIIDVKNSSSSTWKRKEHFLFNSEEDRLKKENWDLISSSLLDDVAKICIYDLPTLLDSLNIAIVKKSSGSEISQYEIRYFGFDFSSKSTPLSIPTIQERLSKAPNMGKAKEVLNEILSWVFFYEFGRGYNRNDDEGKKLQDLKNVLVEKYSKEVIARINKTNPVSLQ